MTAENCPMPADYLCRKFNISRTTFWRWRKAGLPALVVGGKIFVREADIIGFLERMDGQTASAVSAKTEEKVP